jgi:hypothetical protein
MAIFDVCETEAEVLQLLQELRNVGAGNLVVELSANLRILAIQSASIVPDDNEQPSTSKARVSITFLCVCFLLTDHIKVGSA